MYVVASVWHWHGHGHGHADDGLLPPAWDAVKYVEPWWYAYGYRCCYGREEGVSKEKAYVGGDVHMAGKEAPLELM